MSSPIFQLSNIQKRYGRVVALDLRTLELFANERVVVVGGNGSGKSTLLKILAGLTLPSSGSKNLEEGWHEATIGYLPQEGGIYQDLTINQNAIVFGRLLGRRGDARRHSEIADLLGLSQLLDRSVHALSGGFRRLAAIFCLLVSRVEILLLDEPFASLDRAKQDAVEQALMLVSPELSLLVVSEHLTNLSGSGQSGFWSRTVELVRATDDTTH